MTIYYFSKNITKNGWKYGTGKSKLFQTKEELIKDANTFFEECGCKRLSKKDVGCITSTELAYDFYSVQSYCDGFGNDTYTVCCFKTFTEARKYVERTEGEFKIVGQRWGVDYNNFYN